MLAESMPAALLVAGELYALGVPLCHWRLAVQRRARRGAGDDGC